MRFLVTLYQDEDGLWIAEVPAVPGCVSQGTTKEEAAANIQDALRGCLEVNAEMGFEPLAVETREVEVFV